MVFQNHGYCQLCLENGCYTCLFQVIHQISPKVDLYVYESTSMSTPTMCDWYYGILLIPRHLLVDNAHHSVIYHQSCGSP